MSRGSGVHAVVEHDAEDLYERAPAGYLSTALDGTVVMVNRTFESWTGYGREELVGRKRMVDLLGVGGRIYWETHLAPLLLLQGEVHGIAVEILRADGSKLPALLSAVVEPGDLGQDRLLRLAIFDATDRRLYEQELLRRSRREQEIARTLQRSLLSGTLAQADGVELGASYRPGVEGLEVGGDWYDVFWVQPGESLALVVGDVVGRGIEAAATMGQLRSAVRALASTDLEPGQLLAALDAYASRHAVGELATVAYATLHVPSGTLLYACAGHPPPAVVRPGRRPIFLWHGRRPALDTLSPESGAPQGACRLSPRSVLVLFTDGLVERRSRPLDEGMAILADELAAHADEPMGSLTATLVRRLTAESSADDVCVLAARLS